MSAPRIGPEARSHVIGGPACRNCPGLRPNASEAVARRPAPKRAVSTLSRASLLAALRRGSPATAGDVSRVGESWRSPVDDRERHRLIAQRRVEDCRTCADNRWFIAQKGKSVDRSCAGPFGDEVGCADGGLRIGGRPRRRRRRVRAPCASIAAGRSRFRSTRRSLACRRRVAPEPTCAPDQGRRHARVRRPARSRRTTGRPHQRRSARAACLGRSSGVGGPE